jgi:hypothetical protein
MTSKSVLDVSEYGLNFLNVDALCKFLKREKFCGSVNLTDEDMDELFNMGVI